MSIPRIIHQVWVGPRPRPRRMMATWRDMNRGSWEYRLWGSAKARAYVLDAHDTDWFEPAYRISADPWRNQAALDDMFELNGKSDIMRYEILLEHGGVYVDADAECTTPLDDSLLAHEAFATYEHEAARPGVITGAFLGSVPGGALMRALVAGIPSCNLRQPAWVGVGPSYLTATVARMGAAARLHVLPSGAFAPSHYSGAPPVPYAGPQYGDHKWGNTLARYKGNGDFA